MRKFVLSSYPDFSDNSWCMFIGMLEQGIQGKYIWLYKDVDSLEVIHKKVNLLSFDRKKIKIKYIPKNTLRGIYHYFTSKYIFTTHGMFEQFPLLRYQIKVNLWHGMPLKKIGNYDNKNSTRFKLSYTISNGTLFDDVVSNSFGINKSQLLKVGSPRNDILFKTSSFNFYEIFKNHFDTIIWMPTYRKSNIGDIREDGLFQEEKISFLDLESIRKLNTMLADRHVNIFIKLHPMDILNQNSIFIQNVNKLSNIKMMNGNNRLFEKYSLYEILKPSKSLITDYSSILFDYVLLNQPIGLLIDDKKKYMETRGFIDSIEKEIVGFTINDFQDLTDFIDYSLCKEDVINKNKQLYQTYDHQGKNTQKILELLGIEKK
ncbi:hypothetical protein EY693_04490 [Enterococcus casseliflavus]|uniref:CDP-glycerol glycerophosphotransferase family protein n=1 Tax=Enterococcus casseliflavus TaxID=37734 RepID=UPI001AD7C47A|nr:CDP-glycerol glycerophosphotransferase family protein [Enterococcus casseliflavus]MBO6357953.1 hypothetical protein [Enterococcus casseliflavus]MBO6375599.1 hypothetical protein [Enterococcus casseliflavus]